MEEWGPCGAKLRSVPPIMRWRILANSFMFNIIADRKHRSEQPFPNGAKHQTVRRQKDT